MRINHQILKKHWLQRHKSVDRPLWFFMLLSIKRGGKNRFGKTMNWDAQK
jgi:hypothetical protein